MSKAREIAETRLAKGEITEQEFHSIIDRLETNPSSENDPEQDTIIQTQPNTTSTTNPSEIVTKKPKSRIGWWVFGSVLLVSLLMVILNSGTNSIISLSGETTAHKKPATYGIWSFKQEKDLHTHEVKQYILGVPTRYEGTKDRPFIRIGCYSQDMGITLYWGNVLADLYPSGDMDAVRVTARFGQAETLQLGWIPSDDFASTYPPNPVAGAITSFSDSLLTALIPVRDPVSFTWKPEELNQLMRTYSRSQSQLVVRARNRGSGNTTIIFDLAGYDRLASKHFSQHCLN